LCVGRLHPEKSIDTIIKSMQYVTKSHKDVTLLIVGSGYMEKSLKLLSSRCNVKKNVKFLGRISNEDLIQAYNVCDIFVHASLVELEGMALLEAMACGNPVIVSDSMTSAARYIVKGNGFLFREMNSKDLANKILTLIKDETLKKSMSKKSLEISKKYDINYSVNKMERVYKKVAS
jgi:glycosyltransferase involved in cell wall biosynthesis